MAVKATAHKTQTHGMYEISAARFRGPADPRDDERAAFAARARAPSAKRRRAGTARISARRQEAPRVGVGGVGAWRAAARGARLSSVV